MSRLEFDRNCLVQYPLYDDYHGIYPPFNEVTNKKTEAFIEIIDNLLEIFSLGKNIMEKLQILEV